MNSDETTMSKRAQLLKHLSETQPSQPLLEAMRRVMKSFTSNDESDVPEHANKAAGLMLEILQSSESESSAILALQEINPEYQIQKQPTN